MATEKERSTRGSSATHRGGSRRVVVARGVLLLVGVALIWFGTVRLISPWTVVKTIHLQGEAAKSPDASPKTLRVGCYNIAHGRGGRFGAANWEGGSRTEKIERLHRVAELLRSERLDLVVLNEVDFSSIWSGHLDQARMIAREAGFAYVVEQRNIDVAVPLASLRFGNAILSRYPLSDAIFLDYPHTSKLAEVLLGGFKDGVAATVHLSEAKRVQVVAVHLSVDREADRVASARLILELQRRSSLPLVAMGDFNTAPRGYPTHRTDARGENAIDLLLASGQVTTLLPGLPVPPRELTFPSGKPERLIDWILVSPPWRIRERSVLQVDTSDHLPVIATLARIGPLEKVGDDRNERRLGGPSREP